MAFSPETYALLKGEVNAINSAVSAKGTVYSGVNNGANAITVGASFKNTNEIELEAGTYLICGIAGFSGNLDSSKTMQISLYDVTNAVTYATTKGTLGQGGGVSIVTVLTLSAYAKLRTRCAQNSGNDLDTAQNLMFAIKL